ncbi:MAG: DNA primase, partial [Pseudobutyrivibrio sp.]|nr:DNA primase [Pseudobutyrivibrio sp.]
MYDVPDFVKEAEAELARRKDFDPKAAAEARKKEMDDIMAKLEQGVKDVFASEDYKKLLTVMANMPHYSVNNQILIMIQNPQATLCNSFTGWKKQNRFVKAGEKGMRILAPAPYQMEKQQEKTDANGQVIRDGNGEPVMETVKVTINAFKPVSTFDISQTDG